MKTPFLLLCGIVSFTSSLLFADQLQMRNGDRYTGKVLSVSADSVVLQNDILGKISLPRQKVASMAFGTNLISTGTSGAVSSSIVPTNLPSAESIAALANSNTNGESKTEVVKNIREQMLAGSPEAAAKYDELASGLLSGKLNVNDIRREAKASADQLRQMKKELGPDAGDSLDAYLAILDNFLKETATNPATPSPAAKAATP
jgi:hypothetical protein